MAQGRCDSCKVRPAQVRVRVSARLRLEVTERTDELLMFIDEVHTIVGVGKTELARTLAWAVFGPVRDARPARARTSGERRAP